MNLAQIETQPLWTGPHDLHIIQVCKLSLPPVSLDGLDLQSDLGHLHLGPSLHLLSLPQVDHVFKSIVNFLSLFEVVIEMTCAEVGPEVERGQIFG
jgi:hypothetical protein